MINKRKYFEEVEKLLNEKSNLDIEDFNSLYKALCNSYSGDDSLNGIEIANKILADLFNIPVLKDVLIPLSFLETEIGRVILQVKFGVEDDRIYITEEVAAMLDFSVQYIIKEAKNGNIVAEQRGRNWLFKGKDVDAYLLKKGQKIRNRNKEKYEEKAEEIKNIGYERENEYK
jgi:excisionase family DNA binding protein